MSDMVEILRGLGMDDIAEEIESLRARIVELEALVATVRGTLERGTLGQGPEAFGVTYDVPHNTPR